eukprot:jgi/Bigna1/136765/aug1.35_g11473
MIVENGFSSTNNGGKLQYTNSRNVVRRGVRNKGGRSASPGPERSVEDDFKKIQSALNGEKVLWAGTVKHVTGLRGQEPKSCLLIVTDGAIYKVRLQDRKITRRIVFKELVKLTFNLDNRMLIMHCKEGQYRYRTSQRAACNAIVNTIDKAVKAFERQLGIVRRGNFCVKIATPTKTSQSLNQQGGNFYMCFCVAGYGVCDDFHPQFDCDAHSDNQSTASDDAGLDMSNWRRYFDQKSGRPYWHNHKTSESTWYDPSIAIARAKEVKRAQKDSHITVPTSSKGRRRKPASAAVAAAQKLREKNAEERAKTEDNEEKLNIEALEKLLELMGDVRKKGFTYLCSKFVRNPDAYLKSNSDMSHYRQLRRARNERKKNASSLQINPAIGQFLEGTPSAHFLKLAGIKLLRNVYKLPQFHLDQLENEALESLEDYSLSKARQKFLKIVKRLENRKYDLLSIVGKGSFGSVYMARPLPGKFPTLQKGTRVIAVKSIDMSDEEDLTELSKEIEVLAEGEVCSQLVQYYGCESIDRFLMLSMELMDGAIDKLKPLPEAAVAVIMRESLLGLSFLWNKYKKFHRDLKGANILYTLRGDVKLADFGCVRSLGGNTRLATTKVGSPYWMAPEVIKDQPYNQLVDVWSLGITCIEIVTGKVPCQGQGMTQAMDSILKDPAPRLSERYSKEIKDFIVACVDKEPSDRVPVDELLKLDFITQAGDVDSWLPNNARPPPAPPRR